MRSREILLLPGLEGGYYGTPRTVIDLELRQE